MSVESLAIVLHHSEASGTAKVVILGIANHDGDGGAWPTIETLAKYARCSERTVQRALADLEASGEITIRLQRGGDLECRGDRRPNRYDLNVACPANCDRTTNHRPLKRGDTDVAPLADGVTPVTERGDTCDANGVTPVSPKPSLQPSLEPEEQEPLVDVVADPTPEELATDRVCTLLADLIEANGSKRPKVPDSWRQSVRLMIERDKRTIAQIEWIVRWSQQDEFWRSNILSMPKLRLKFDQLRLAASAKNGTAVSKARLEAGAHKDPTPRHF